MPINDRWTGVGFERCPTRASGWVVDCTRYAWSAAWFECCPLGGPTNVFQTPLGYCMGQERHAVNAGPLLTPLRIHPSIKSVFNRRRHTRDCAGVERSLAHRVVERHPSPPIPDGPVTPGSGPRGGWDRHEARAIAMSDATDTRESWALRAASLRGTGARREIQPLITWPGLSSRRRRLSSDRKRP
jgi:hypothetical protein